VNGVRRLGFTGTLVLLVVTVAIIHTWPWASSLAVAGLLVVLYVEQRRRRRYRLAARQRRRAMRMSVNERILYRRTLSELRRRHPHLGFTADDLPEGMRRHSRR
jgi:hypothetical protein